VTDCTPSCGTDQVCGSDGCGGSCGLCPSDQTCNGGKCEKDCFFEHQTYTFDGSALDWSNVNYVAVRARQKKTNGEWSSWKNVTLDVTETAASISFGGVCDPDAEVIRRYSVKGGIQCESQPEAVGTNSITIPAPTVDGNSCTAPPLQ
jgi:hypothetical protein